MRLNASSGGVSRMLRWLNRLSRSCPPSGLGAFNAGAVHGGVVVLAMNDCTLKYHVLRPAVLKSPSVVRSGNLKLRVAVGFDLCRQLFFPGEIVAHRAFIAAVTVMHPEQEVDTVRIIRDIG